MSLTDLRVHNLLAKHFICAWQNTEGDPDAGRSNRHACGTTAMPLSRGTGKANVQTLVLTPDGRILHAISGYIGPDELLEELAHALDVWHTIERAPEVAPTLVRARIHRRLQAEQKAIEDEVARASRRGAVHRWRQSIVQWDLTFVAGNALMPVDEFRTRMLTRGRAGHFGYSASTSFDRDRQPKGLTRAEFEKLPKVLKRAFEAAIPDAFHGDPTMIGLDELPKGLRPRIEHRLRIIRKAEAKRAARELKRARK